MNTNNTDKKLTVRTDVAISFAQNGIRVLPCNASPYNQMVSHKSIVRVVDCKDFIGKSAR